METYVIWQDYALPRIWWIVRPLGVVVGLSCLDLLVLCLL